MTNQKRELKMLEVTPWIASMILLGEEGRREESRGQKELAQESEGSADE